MRVEVQKITGIDLLRKAYEFTQPVDNQKEVKLSFQDAYSTEHSPMYSQIYAIYLYEIPYFVHVHLRTHKKNFIGEYARTFRSDNTKVKQDRDTLTDMMIICNAKTIIDICKQRLCSKAAFETQQTVNMIVEALKKQCDILYKFCVPKCVYRNGICQEYKSCGYVHSGGFEKSLNAYRELFKNII